MLDLKSFISSAKSLDNVPYHSVQGKTIVQRNLCDSSLDGLTQSELGFLFGYVGAKDGATLEDLIKSLSVESHDFKSQVPVGFLAYTESTLPPPTEVPSLSDSVKSYKKCPSVSNFIKVLDASDYHLKTNEDDYVLTSSGNSEYSVGIKVPKTSLSHAKELLDTNPDLEVKGEDDESVLLGYKDNEVTSVSDDLDDNLPDAPSVDQEVQQALDEDSSSTSISESDIPDISDSTVIDGDEYDLLKVNKDKYEVLKNGMATYTLEKKQSNWTCTCPGFKYRRKCRHLGLLNDVIPQRRPLSDLQSLVPEIKSMFEPVFGPMKTESNDGRWAIAGSFRRQKSTVKDIDIIVECPKSEFYKVLDILQQDPNYQKTVTGNDIIRGKYHGWDFDVSRVEPGCWATYLLYRTGPASLNVKMRALAKSKGLALNEKGLFNRETGVKIPTETEEDVFKALGMPYLKPEDRDI